MRQHPRYIAVGVLVVATESLHSQTAPVPRASSAALAPMSAEPVDLPDGAVSALGNLELASRLAFFSVEQHPRRRHVGRH